MSYLIYQGKRVQQNHKYLRSGNSPITFADWFLPSLQELSAIRALYLDGKGGINTGTYWSSSDYDTAQATDLLMSSGGFNGTSRSASRRVRPIRSFISATVYNLHDTGPSGGFIVINIDNGNGTFTYYECHSVDLTSSIWSNINTIVAAQGDWSTRTAVGSGLNNTNAIIAQVGHTNSAALLCRNLSITN